MPSIQDVVDQANARFDEASAKLETLVQNTGAIANNTAAINAGVHTMDAHLQSGLANLSGGLFALIQLEKASLALQEHNRKQNDTIICLLDHSNEMLCGITRKLSRQLALSEGILGSVRRTEEIVARVHAGAAADHDRLAALNAKIEECCPPEPPPLEPCPGPCAKPTYRPHDLQGQNWEPLPAPARQDGPAGSGNADA